MNICKHRWILFVPFWLLVACEPQTLHDPQNIIDRAIEAHGGMLYSKSIIEFDFRGRHYYRYRENGKYEFRREWKDSTEFIQDFLSNSGFKRQINGDIVEVDSEWAAKYTRSVNSVIYFALLPFRLNDEAVVKKLNGLTSIKDQNYYEVLIRFNQEGGGEDFQDEFLYWVNAATFRVDFFAYSYETDGGGIRFREASKKVRVGGILFQNYNNYGEPKERTIKLNEILEEYKKGHLPLLSKIDLENIKVTPL